MLETIIAAYLIMGLLITVSLGDVFSSVYIDWQDIWLDILLFIFGVIISPAIGFWVIAVGIIEKFRGKL
jgi:hypothetical protein